MTSRYTGVMTIQPDGSFSFVFEQSMTLLHGQKFRITLEQMPDMHAMRRIRLRAWRLVMVLSKRMDRMAQTAPGYVQLRQQYQQAMETVQTLNDLFPVGDTAERDDTLMSVDI